MTGRRRTSARTISAASSSSTGSAARGTSPCPVTGACCVDGPTAVTCTENVLGDDCVSAGGAWHYALSCSEIREGPCAPPPIGACCEVGGSCMDTEQTYCGDMMGTWFADYDCATLPPDLCPSAGACCTPGETCRDNVEYADCYSLYSGYATPGKTCAELNDEECQWRDRGACCTGQNGCENGVTEAACLQELGTFYAAASCEDEEVTCGFQESGACCHPDVTVGDPYGIQLMNCLDHQSARTCAAYNAEASWFTQASCGDIYAECPGLGACYTAASCQDGWSYDDCTAQIPGAWFSTGSLCMYLTGACAWPGTCADDVTASACAALDTEATFSYGRSCWDIAGACCTTDACVDDLTEYECASQYPAASFTHAVACDDFPNGCQAGL